MAEIQRSVKIKISTTSFIYIFVLLALLTNQVQVDSVLADGIVGSVLDFISNSVSESCWLNAMLTVGVLSLSVKFCKFLYNDKFRLWRLITFVVAILYLQHPVFWHFPDTILPQLGYDVLLCVLLIIFSVYDISLFADMFTCEETLQDVDINSVGGFCMDKVYGALEDTGWEAYAKRLVSMLPKERLKDESLAIGVTGEWGSGKTTFLEHTKKYLDDYVIVDFEPWGCTSANQIITEFFTSMKESLVDDKELTALLSKYKDTLIEADIHPTVNFLVNTFISNETESSIQAMKTEVGDLIAGKDKPIVVIIDDLDRLESEEIFEVLKLIRVTANFKNITFIVAYDRKYICEMLGKKIQDADTYVEKIFHVEIALPKFDYSLLLRVLYLEIVRMTGMDSNRSNELWQAMHVQMKGDSQKLLHKYIKNFRNVRRLANVFALNYSFMSENSKDYDIADFFWLEVLRINNQEVYNTLKLQPTKLLDTATDARGGRYFQYNKKEGDGVNEDASLMSYLFGANANKRRVHVCFINSYSNYFCYRLPKGRVGVTEFNTLVKAGVGESIEKQISEWGKDSQKRSSLYEVLHSYDISLVADDHELRNYIKALLAASRYYTKKDMGNIFSEKFRNNICNIDNTGSIMVEEIKWVIDNSGASGNWNYIVSRMSNVWHQGEDCCEDLYILSNPQIKELCEYNLNKYIEKVGVPPIESITNDTEFHKFIEDASYIDTVFDYYDNVAKEYKEEQEHSNFLFDSLLSKYQGGNATSFSKFIEPYTINNDDDGSNYEYELEFIQRQVTYIFDRWGKFEDFVSKCFQPSEEIDKYFKSMK